MHGGVLVCVRVGVRGRPRAPRACLGTHSSFSPAAAARRKENLIRPNLAIERRASRNEAAWPSVESGVCSRVHASPRVLMLTPAENKSSTIRMLQPKIILASYKARLVQEV